jgi:hypothetical protein
VGKASSQKQSRREMIEKMQRDQARADRNRTLLIVVASIVVGLAIIAYPAIRLIQDSQTRNQAIAELGVDAAAASCDKIIDDPATGTQDHKPDGEVIAYAVSPPSSGPHYAVWAPFGKKFYTVDDRPAVPNLVHNLEHGYTILWYDESVADDSSQIAAIKAIAATLDDNDTNGRLKFKAVPWTDDDGKGFPKGQHVAFTHWRVDAEAQKQYGAWQYCSEASGEALEQFMDKYPFTDAPEPYVP